MLGNIEPLLQRKEKAKGTELLGMSWQWEKFFEREVTLSQCPQKL